ncbi:MAG: PAS domain S-box protein [Cyclobacteriaceae bacterium]|nr:PAS domain S-box protein [Cyclobacteriaceae bacterium]
MKTKVWKKTSIEANIFYNQPTGVLAFNFKFEIIICNNSFLQKAGKRESEFKGINLFDVVKFDENKSSIKSQILAGENFKNFINIGKKRFEVDLTPLWEDAKVVGGTISLGEEILGNPKLNYLSKTGFKSVIENAPMTIMIFRKDGSIFFTNQYYRDLWGLSDKELYLIHEYYNIFDDKQLNNQAIGPYLKKAFDGNYVEIPVVNYVLDYSGLGRKDGTSNKNWLLGYFFPIEITENKESLVALIFTEITRQVEAEQAFKLSQERLELALEGGELGIWDWDLENNSMVYNRQWAKILGYELDEIDMFSWTGLVHSDDLDWVEEKLNKHIANKTDSYFAEYRVKSKTGEWKWILDRGKVVEFTRDGKAKRIAGTHLDITSKKQSEVVLKASEERYRNLIDNLPIGVAIVQEDEIIFANRELYTIVKAEKESELIGLQASKCFLNPDGYHNKVNQILRSGKSEPSDEVRIKDLKGNSRCVEITSIPVTHNGKPAVQSIIKDIQLRKDIEGQTQKAEKLLSQLFENAPMGIVMLGFDDEILKINKGFEQMFGYTSEESVGRYINDIIVPDNLAQEGFELSKDSVKGKITYTETQRVSKSNELLPVMIHTLPVIHEGQRLGVYGIYIDLRKRIRVEEELKIRNLELDNFVYKVSHDLRSPLASILGLINLVKLEGDFQDSFEYLKLMENQVHKLDHFIHDVLSHSKNLKMSIVASPIDFKDVVDKCISDLSYLDGFEDVRKKVTVKGGGFLSDKWRINEMFRNLLANSIKYKDRSKDDNKLNVFVDSSPNGCKIIISDNGIGIVKESVSRVFEMFYRATDTSKGSGIGLYIVKNATEKLGGTIALESKFGVGTTFTIELPNLPID